MLSTIFVSMPMLTNEQYDPEMLPNPIDYRKVSARELAMAWRRQWQVGQELKVRFLGGSPYLQRRVERHARSWLQYANLAFRFGNHVDAEIRISFTGSGYWSLIGTDAIRAGDDHPTMQLGGFTDESDEIELRRVVLHEFGHALGCIHEQASPAASIPWDEHKVYEFYRASQGWDDQTIYRNVLLRYSAPETRFSTFDRASIMQYPIPKSLTIGGFEVGWNNDLSDADKSFIALMYPP